MKIYYYIPIILGIYLLYKGVRGVIEKRIRLYGWVFEGTGARIYGALTAIISIILIIMIATIAIKN